MAWELTGNGNIGPGFVGTTDQENIQRHDLDAVRLALPDGTELKFR